ncbi:MAG: hemerythrin family protein [Halioglobus sp.]
MAFFLAGAIVDGMQKTSDLVWQDAQHQVLFEILDDIRKPESGAEVLQRLWDYTETHFTLEERYMDLLAFPGREKHLKAHNRFREEVLRLLEPGQQHDAVFMGIISTYLTEWLKRHVFGIDKELEAFILESSIK